MKILVTGAAGFIGAATSISLLRRKHEVVGLDNLNDYYDVSLKLGRLAQAGINAGIRDSHIEAHSRIFPGYTFMRMNLTDRDGLKTLFDREKFDTVVNLAGQAGVRYSLENPFAYIDSNVTGFLNVLECCRSTGVGHLVYASSSSVYGLSGEESFKESDCTDRPVSLYAATKKSDELMAHAYSHLFGIRTTGLRFFTVYGPWGRPDMAPFIFLDSVLKGNGIRIFNQGRMWRDFTFIDDVVDTIVRITESKIIVGHPLHTIYNVGNSKPVYLLDFINVIERVTNKRAVLNLVEMQPGDVMATHADTSRLKEDFGIVPSVTIEEGMSRFYEWFRNYHHIPGHDNMNPAY